MKNYGFQFNINEIQEDNYIFGGSSINREILQPNGDWSKHLPRYEPQSTDKFDSDGCVVYGTQNGIEMLMKKKYQIDINYSERFQYNLIPVRPPGTSPHIVAENIRKSGLVEQSKLPMVDTFEEYITPVPMDDKLIKEGLKWLESYEFKHEYLWKIPPSIKNQHKLIKEALKYSPVGVSVTAWYEKEDGTYEDLEQPNNHWCICFGYEGNSPLIFDSYDHEIKKLDQNHHIEVAKNYYVNIRTKPLENKGFIDKLLAWFKGL